MCILSAPTPGPWGPADAGFPGGRTAGHVQPGGTGLDPAAMEPADSGRGGVPAFPRHRAIRHAARGGLRIDHVIGMFRLWWIPPGAPATAGTYVLLRPSGTHRHPVLEAFRAGVTLSGGPGTVEPWARDVLSDRGILGTTVLLFEREGDTVHDPNGWRTECLASVTVHDLPPTAQYLAGSLHSTVERTGPARPARRRGTRQSWTGSWDLGPRPARGGSARRGSGTEPHSRSPLRCTG